MSIINYVRGVGVLVTGTVAAYITQNSQFPLKDSAPDNPFAPLVMNTDESKRVVVIGEGIVSLMTAYYVMSRVGYVVVVVNTENEECTNSAYPAPSILSFGSIPLRQNWQRCLSMYSETGSLRWLWKRTENAPQHIGLRIKMMEETNKLFKQLLQRESWTQHALGLNKQGLLKYRVSQADFTNFKTNYEAHINQKALKLEQGEDALRRLKTNNLKASTGGFTLFSPSSLGCNSKLVLGQVQKLLEFYANSVLNHKEMIFKGFKVDGTGKKIVAVETNKGFVQADIFILCSGIDSKQILKKSGIFIPMATGKRHSIRFKLQDENRKKMPYSVLLDEEKQIAVVPMNVGEYEVSETDLLLTKSNNTGVDQRNVDKLVKYVEDEFAVKELQELHSRSHMTLVSPDFFPYIGQSQKYENLFLNVAHAGHELENACSAGKHVADLVTGFKPQLETDAFSCDRFK